MEKNHQRDILTGKLIGNKEVICAENAIDYVKKQGYLVIRPKNILETTLVIISCLGIYLFVGIGAIRWF